MFTPMPRMACSINSPLVSVEVMTPEIFLPPNRTSFTHLIFTAWPSATTPSKSASELDSPPFTATQSTTALISEIGQAKTGQNRVDLGRIRIDVRLRENIDLARDLDFQVGVEVIPIQLFQNGPRIGKIVLAGVLITASKYEMDAELFGPCTAFRECIDRALARFFVLIPFDKA